jgi:hypothetical protein
LSYSPKRIGKPEGFPWYPLDATHPRDRHRLFKVTTATPKAAMMLSVETGIALVDTVWQLRQLEIRKAVKHTTDANGLMTWSRADGRWYEPPPF